MMVAREASTFSSNYRCIDAEYCDLSKDWKLKIVLKDEQVFERVPLKQLRKGRFSGKDKPSDLSRFIKKFEGTGYRCIEASFEKPSREKKWSLLLVNMFSGEKTWFKWADWMAGFTPENPRVKPKKSHRELEAEWLERCDIDDDYDIVRVYYKKWADGSGKWHVEVFYKPNKTTFNLNVNDWERGQRPKREKLSENKIREKFRRFPHIVVIAVEKRDKKWFLEVIDKRCGRQEWVKLRSFINNPYLSKLTKAEVIERANAVNKDYIAISAIHRGSWQVKIMHVLSKVTRELRLNCWERVRHLLPKNFAEIVTCDTQYEFLEIEDFEEKICVWRYLPDGSLYRARYNCFRRGVRKIRNTYAHVELKRLALGEVVDPGPTWLFLLKIEVDGVVTHKIGISSYSAEHRYHNTDGAKLLELLYRLHFPTRLQALIREKWILDRTIRYEDKRIRSSWAGFTECRLPECLDEMRNYFEEVQQELLCA